MIIQTMLIVCLARLRAHAATDTVDGLDCFKLFFFFKQKTAYEIGTGDWSSDVALPIYKSPFIQFQNKHSKWPPSSKTSEESGCGLRN